MSKQIKLRVERDFSESISTTFDFLRYNFKMIMTLLVRIPGPLLIFSVFLIIPYYINAFDMTSKGIVDFDPTTMTLFGIGMLIYFVASILSILAVNEFIGLYLKSESPELITVKDVYAKVKTHFWEYLGGYLLLGLIVMVGFVLLFIPGIYLGVALMLTFSVITIEKVGVFDGISRSYKLIAGNWWSTFGLMFVIMILTVFIMYLFILPLGMITGFLLVSSDFGWFASFSYGLVNSLTLVVSFFLSAIYFIAINIKYFSLVEQKEQVGLKEQIEEMNLVQDTTE